jgi:ubiquinone/menaquinone biosynthesis C-methylase UbiE
MTTLWDAVWKRSQLPPRIYWYSEEFIRYLIKWSSAKPYTLSLEPGAGSGRFGYYFSKRGKEVVVLDLSRNSIAMLKKLKDMSEGFLHVIRADILRMPLRDSSFDFVYNEGVVEHFTDPNPVLREMARVTANRGTMVVSVPHTFSFHTFARQVLSRFFSASWRHRLWPYGFERSFSKNEVKRMLQLVSLQNVEVHCIGFLYGFARYMPRRIHVLLHSIYIKIRDTKLGRVFTEQTGFQVIGKGVKISTKTKV